ncbi:hypothetical protein BELL_0562g00040 [Botrytis elliptica]|uniref:Peptidase S53 domain-containing protein n=1 Tax=Botrytis elliptica TaxID=278938 RepID=A0A4Z1JE59_9HELO|nr:hypothetical protein EAE99_002509 [Botrytis elliptica]TGO71534.1 hypothetical protein BELL_0562g00040 [Botrytis elliptica]
MLLFVRRIRTSIFEQTLLKISSPDHVLYGQHMSRNEVENMLRPTRRVGRQFGVGSSTQGFLAVTSRIIVTTASKSCRLCSIIHSSGAEKCQLGNKGYGIYSIQSLRTLLHTSSSSSRPVALNVHYQAEINDRNVIGVASFLNESARYSDLALFEEKLAPGALGQNMTVFSINGAPNDQSPGSSTEANLDIQHVIDMANGVHVIIANASLLILETCLASHRILVPEYDHPGLHGSNEPYLDLLRYLLRLPEEELPSTISVSYGEDEQMVPRSYARQTCFMIAQLGARGTSVIVTSGGQRRRNSVYEKRRF